MYTSKSLLSSMPIGRIEFDCESIVAWLHANGGKLPEGAALPISLQASPMGSPSCYGAVYRLLNYPGLVLKVCFNPRDGYPEYIRQHAIRKPKAWAPKVFAYGGDEARGGFWCVMPTYSPVDHIDYHDLPRKVRSVFDMVGRLAIHYRVPEWTRTVAHDLQAAIAAMRKHYASVDMHTGNLMVDPSTGNPVLIDPIGYWDTVDKETYRRAHS